MYKYSNGYIHEERTYTYVCGGHSFLQILFRNWMSRKTRGKKCLHKLREFEKQKKKNE